MYIDTWVGTSYIQFNERRVFIRIPFYISRKAFYTRVIQQYTHPYNVYKHIYKSIYRTYIHTYTYFIIENDDWFIWCTNTKYACLAYNMNWYSRKVMKFLDIYWKQRHSFINKKNLDTYNSDYNIIYLWSVCICILYIIYTWIVQTSLSYILCINTRHIMYRW